MHLNIIHNKSCLTGLKDLPDNSIHCCVTSPPYFGLRDYGNDEQLGLEETPDKFIAVLTEVFNEVRRVLKPEGTLWLNIGDTYSAHKDCKSVSDTLRVGGKSESANVLIKGISHSRNSKMLKSVGLKNKDLIGVPWALAFSLRSSGWYLRQDIIWSKPNPMPESVTDRCTKSHEYIFLLSKSSTYYYDQEAIAESCVWDTGGLTEKRVDRSEENHKAMPTEFKNGIRPKKKGPQTFGGKKARELQLTVGDPRNGNRTDENSQWGKVWESDKPTRNKRSVWTVTTRPYAEAHFATFPERLIVDCIKAGCPENGIVLDPFMGAGTTAVVARKLNRNYIGFEINSEYIKIAEKRISKEIGMFQ